MGDKARKYTDMTLKRLFGMSGNQCSFPSCEVRLTTQNSAANSNICHIEAANEKGQRFNPDMTDEERADYPNLIVLCPDHHIATNDVDLYPVIELKRMKAEHEALVMSRMMSSRPTMLFQVINALADLPEPDEVEEQSIESFSIEAKIEFNNLNETRIFVEEYAAFSQQINLIYDELELQGSVKKAKLLRTVRDCYLSVVSQYMTNGVIDMASIQANSDKIFAETYEHIYSLLSETTMFEEDVIYGLRLIMVDAFMRCKIFEAPVQ